MTLEVRMGNMAAQQMYRNFGFVSSGIRRNYYPETGEDALIMWLYDLLSPRGAGAPGRAGEKPVKVLAIETSCDETAAAVVEDGYRVLSSVVSSQTEIHADFGGVVPEIASRAHLDLIAPVVGEALSRAATDPGRALRRGRHHRAGPHRLSAGRRERSQGLRLVLGRPLRRGQPYGRPSSRRFPRGPGAVVADGGTSGLGRPHDADIACRTAHRASTSCSARR